MITYSDVMYKASEVQSKYGYDPRQFDLSRIPKWEDFRARNELRHDETILRFGAWRQDGRAGRRYQEERAALQACSLS